MVEWLKQRSCLETQEIERDKKNEEALSREALARMKEMAAVGAKQPVTEEEEHKKNQKVEEEQEEEQEEQQEEQQEEKQQQQQQQQPKQRKSGRKLTTDSPPTQLTLTYRPQRLSEVSHALSLSQLIY